MLLASPRQCTALHWPAGRYAVLRPHALRCHRACTRHAPCQAQATGISADAEDPMRPRTRALFAQLKTTRALPPVAGRAGPELTRASPSTAVHLHKGLCNGGVDGARDQARGAPQHLHEEQRLAALGARRTQGPSQRCNAFSGLCPFHPACLQGFGRPLECEARRRRPQAALGTAALHQRLCKAPLLRKPRCGWPKRLRGGRHQGLRRGRLRRKQEAERGAELGLGVLAAQAQEHLEVTGKELDG
mmetsp:Transcript_27159/g.74661  ORF Transcript_27159/g.74661 Transcript_27159/m.74661 type:complete len:245 (-) Transcript_27159:387-1121(-)